MRQAAVPRVVPERQPVEALEEVGRQHGLARARGAPGRRRGAGPARRARRSNSGSSYSTLLEVVLEPVLAEEAVDQPQARLRLPRSGCRSRSAAGGRSARRSRPPSAPNRRSRPPGRGAPAPRCGCRPSRAPRAWRTGATARRRCARTSRSKLSMTQATLRTQQITSASGKSSRISGSRAHQSRLVSKTTAFPPGRRSRPRPPPAGSPAAWPRRGTPPSRSAGSWRSAASSTSPPTGPVIAAANRGFCRRSPASSVEPERGRPEMKCRPAWRAPGTTRQGASEQTARKAGARVSAGGGARFDYAEQSRRKFAPISGDAVNGWTASPGPGVAPSSSVERAPRGKRAWRHSPLDDRGRQRRRARCARRCSTPTRAAGADTIVFDAASSTARPADIIRLTSGQIDITDALTIDGGAG